MELTEQQKEIALRVAGVDPELRIGVCWSQKQIIDFAARFLAALPKPEPVAYADAFGNVITKATKEFSRNVLTNEFNRPLYATPPASNQSPIAWATTNEDGDYAMLFFDKQEALIYSGDDEPIGLAPVSSSAPQPDYKAQRDAERYRWLRDQFWCEQEATFRLGLPDTESATIYNNALDAAIDAAIASVKGGE